MKWRNLYYRGNYIILSILRQTRNILFFILYNFKQVNVVIGHIRYTYWVEIFLALNGVVHSRAALSYDLVLPYNAIIQSYWLDWIWTSILIDQNWRKSWTKSKKKVVLSLRLSISFQIYLLQNNFFCQKINSNCYVFIFRLFVSHM